MQQFEQFSEAFIHPFLVLILNNRNIVDKREKLEQSGYNSVTKKYFNESYTYAWWKLSSPILRIMYSMQSSKYILE